MTDYIAAVDIGGTKITASLVNQEGIAVKVRQETKKTGDKYTLPNQVLELIDRAKAVLNTIDYDESVGTETLAQVTQVGISTCSPFEQQRDYKVLVTPNFCGGLSKDSELPNDWTEIPLEQAVKEVYPQTKIGNDCVTAVVAEHRLGAGKGVDNLVYVTWSTGIGGGAIVDGHVLSGKNGNAPHVGHIYIATTGPECGCGQKGDLESLCSGPAIERLYEEAKNKRLTTKQVFQEYRKGNGAAIGVVRNAARNMARGLVSMNNMFDTELFIIGGSVFMKDGDILQPLVEKEFYNNSFKALTKDTKIVHSALDDNLGDVAALSLVMPQNWIPYWEKTEPWKDAPEPIVIE